MTTREKPKNVSGVKVLMEIHQMNKTEINVREEIDAQTTTVPWSLISAKIICSTAVSIRQIRDTAANVTSNPKIFPRPPSLSETGCEMRRCFSRMKRLR